MKQITREKAERFFNRNTTDKGKIFQDNNQVKVVFNLSNDNRLIVKFDINTGNKYYYIDTTKK